MKRISLTCKDSGKFFHDCKDCEHYDDCDYFNKKEKVRIARISPQQLQLLKMGVRERTKVRRQKEEERRQQYCK